MHPFYNSESMSQNIKIKKRNGRLEEVNLDKVNKCVERASEGLEDVSVSEVVLDASLQLYNKIPTSEINWAVDWANAFCPSHAANKGADIRFSIGKF